MSVDLITAISAVATTVVIAATAAAAIVQLRHMRVSNEIGAILSFRSMLESENHRQARDLTRGGELARALEDPLFRRFLYRGIKRLPTADVPRRYVDLRIAALTIGNDFELIGGMVRNRVAPVRMFIQTFGWVADQSWHYLAEYIATMREYTGNEALFEDFEFLTVACRQWMKQHPNNYPRGAERIILSSRYPLAEEPWLSEHVAGTTSRV